jgi:hypothetical protein
VTFRRTALITVAFAAAVSLPSAASGAVAGLQDDRLQSTPETEIPARLDRLAETGARVTRVDVTWSDIAPTQPTNQEDPFDPAYHWGRLDQILSGLAARSIVPILTVYGAPTWATGGKGPSPGNGSVNPWMPDPASYGWFVGALVRRYNGGFVSPAYTVQPRARHIEVWNEPNLSRYLLPQFTRGRSVAPRNYMRLVSAAYANAKAANPRAVVIIGSGGPKSTTKSRGPLEYQGHGALAWIRAIGRNKRGVGFDAFSQHIYPAQPPKGRRIVIPNWASIPEMLRGFDRVRPKLKLYITEAGYTTKRTAIRTVRVSETQQAAYLRDIFNLRSVRSSRIPAVVWFNLQDNPLWPAGLYREDLTPKPSLAVFTALAGRGTVPTVLAP